jgi:hypothetical protein
MASSRLVTAGESYTPSDINNLRADVLDPVGGHKHNGTDGARVPFANLDVIGASGSDVPSGGSKSYNDLANHVAASQGVHGLGTNGYVMGAASNGLIVQGGFVPSSGSAAITFPTPFTSSGDPVDPISVVVTLRASVPDPVSSDMGITIESISSTGAYCDVDGSNIAGFYWMAIGLKT